PGVTVCIVLTVSPDCPLLLPPAASLSLRLCSLLVSSTLASIHEIPGLRCATPPKRVRDKQEMTVQGNCLLPPATAYSLLPAHVPAPTSKSASLPSLIVKCFVILLLDLCRV